MSSPIDPTRELRKRVDVLVSEIEILKKDADEFSSNTERRTEIDDDIRSRGETLRELQSELENVQRANAPYLEFLGKYDALDELTPPNVVLAAEPLLADVGAAVAKARKVGDFDALALHTVLLEAVLMRLTDAEAAIAKEKAESRQKSLVAAGNVLKEAKEAKAETDRLDAEERDLRRKLEEVTVKRRETEAKESKDVADALEALQVATPEIAVEPPKPPVSVPETTPEPTPSSRLPLFQRAPKAPEPPAPTPPPPPVLAPETTPTQPPPPEKAAVTLPPNIFNPWTIEALDTAWERLVSLKITTGTSFKRATLTREQFIRSLARNPDVARSLGLDGNARASSLFVEMDRVRRRNDTVTYSEFKQFLSRPSRRASTSTIFPDADDIMDNVISVLS